MENSSIISLQIILRDFKNDASDILEKLSFLPLKPSKSWNKGEKIILNKNFKEGFYNNSSWIYEHTFVYKNDILFEDKIKSLLNIFFTYKDELLAIQHNEMNFELEIFYSYENLHNGLSFDKEILRMMLNLNMSLSIYPRGRELLFENLDRLP
ncbi:MAG: DUF4279 domain-containing protein [Saprospiraceae bacterium]|nr:DUF4279 domain-containing protein [Saprospiraceae bacterium]